MINEYLFHTKNQVSIENMMTESGDSVAEWLGTPACHRSSGIAMTPGSDEGDVHILDMTSLTRTLNCLSNCLYLTIVKIAQ